MRVEPSGRLHHGIALALLSACSGSGGEPDPVEPDRGAGAAPAAEVAPTDDARGSPGEGAGGSSASDRACVLVEQGTGPAGAAPVRAETVVSGLEVPWALAFLAGGDLLVTERPGRLRLVRDHALVDEPVATLRTAARGEGGLLGLALHPDDPRGLYLYYTADTPEGPRNRVERWRLSADATSAEREAVILDDIPAARFHNGGRLRVGPDGRLYVGTGDAQQPELARDPDSLAGKLLRLEPDGGVPADNPRPGSPVFLLGIRNTQGFDWHEGRLVVTDHGPTGELGRRGHDEVNVATAADDLGWPTIYGCQTAEGLVAPALTWAEALPPGGAAFYTGDAVSAWRGDVVIASLGARQLHVVELAPDGSVQRHAGYLRGELGRLREAIMGPDGELYVTTSNCDGRGTCPPDGDRIVRITGG